MGAVKKTVKIDSGRGREVVDELDRLDRSVYDAVATSHGPVLDRVMPVLTNVADHGKLWFGVAGVVALIGGARGRRAALRGIGSLAVSSLLTNQVFKRTVTRERPDRTRLPFLRNGRRRPTSSSFPSGHAASAAAFAAGAAGEWPALGVPLGSLASAVGFSRVATGAHYPSDVLGGFLIGSSVAAWLARVVPVPENPVVNRTTLGVTSIGMRPRGEGIVLFVNPSSHSGKGARVLKRVQRSLPDTRIVTLDPDGGEDWADVMRRTATGAEILAVAGGDGTVRTAAAVAMELDLPLAVLPGGTFNHFAKDIGMYPLDDAIRAVRDGNTAKVDAAYVNDGLFVNTASVGTYTDFVRIRERYQRRIGKRLAAVVAAIVTLRRRDSMRVRVDDADLEASLLFLGNGQYVPHGFAPSMRSQLDDGIVDLRILDATAGRRRWGAFFALVAGRLPGSPYYQASSASELDIELLGAPQRIARDGEIGELADRLRVRVDRRALTVIRPRRLP